MKSKVNQNCNSPGDSNKFIPHTLNEIISSPGAEKFVKSGSIVGELFVKNTVIFGFCTKCKNVHSFSVPCSNASVSKYFAFGALAIFANSAGNICFRDYEASLSLPMIYSDIQRKYELGALVCSTPGHSVAFVKRSNGQWYLADDSTVYPINENQLPLTVESQKNPKSLGLSYNTLIVFSSFYYFVGEQK